MRISLRWLSEFIQWNTAYDPWKNSTAVDAIANCLTESTAEVEHIECPCALLQNTCIGQPLKEFLGCNDIVFHIDNHAITHRPDLFSHLGFARECVALKIATWQKKPMQKLQFPKKPIPFRLHIEEKHLMPRYCACVIEIDTLGLTPDWMKRRLEAVDWRTVNLPVDITNFVASEIGVPLHSFDLDDLKGDVHMRKARAGEKITTLDKKEFPLPEGALVLSDNDGIFDLLGIMGGLRSSTKESTRRIYLHAASLDPVSIRRTVIATGHRTDAATVYEKGVPFSSTEIGFLRAIELFLQLIPGARITSKMQSVGNNGHPKPIVLPHAQLESLLGISITPKEVTRIFTDLGFCVKSKNLKTPARTMSRSNGKTQNYSVTPPLWRLRDCSGPHDLAEEIARMYGYNRIPKTIPAASIALPNRNERKKNIRFSLRECGFYEITPSPFVSSTILQKCRLDPTQCLSIDNPLGEETSLLQPSTLSQLLTHAEKNILYADDVFQTFTIAHVFTNDGTEHEELGLLVVPKKNPRLPDHPILKLSSCIHHLLRNTGDASTQDRPKVLTQLHPTICQAFGLSPYAAYAKINLTELFRFPSQTLRATPLPVFPAITYDLTLPWNHQKPAGELLTRLQSASLILEHVAVQDLFAQTPNDASYNLTLRCTYRSPLRTLTEAEVHSEHERLTKLAHTS